MSEPAATEPPDDPAVSEISDPLRPFRNWHGFLLAALAVNTLFAYGMLGQVSEPATAAWHKTLVWLPFNALATAVYYVIMIRLACPGAWGLFYRLLCGGLIIGNWLLMLTA